MYPHSLQPALPTVSISEPTEHDDLATHITQQRHPVIQVPHFHPAWSACNLVVYKPSEPLRSSVLLLDRHDNYLAARLGRGEERMYVGEDLLK